MKDVKVFVYDFEIIKTEQDSHQSFDDSFV